MKPYLHHNILVVYCMVVFFILSCNHQSRLELVKTTGYPSGSGLVYLDKKIFLIGDDIGYMQVLDTGFNPVDTIKFLEDDQRIAKAFKPDLEAATIIGSEERKKILLCGSGSLAPYRNFGWIIDPANKKSSRIDLFTFYNRLRKERIEALNIEGLATIPGNLVFASRGNRSFPSNFLVFTSNEFWNNQDAAEIKIVKVGSNTDTSSFQGVSGLEYAAKSDRLLLTVSSENTSSVYDDGAIGKSYLWIIDNISSKKRMSAVNPTKIIELEQLDERFKGHKIESVCILEETNKMLHLIMVADDDNGSSVLFRVMITD